MTMKMVRPSSSNSFVSAPATQPEDAFTLVTRQLYDIINTFSLNFEEDGTVGKKLHTKRYGQVENALYYGLRYWLKMHFIMVCGV